MKGRIIFGLMCAAVLAFACGPRPSTGEVVGTTHAVHARSAANGPALLGSLDVRVANGVAIDFRVVNTGAHRLEVNFPNGKTHDLVVLDSLGNEVWRWSNGRMFTQTLQNKVLHSADSLDYDAVWHDAPAGTYTAIATLASENFPVEERAKFVVR
jgi:Intracellular proteinase inhibitor